jgi:hypothetical protein
VGVFVSNEGDPVPAYTAAVDYFFSTSSPVVPEDAGKKPDTLPPFIHRVHDIAGQAAFLVSWATEEPGTTEVDYGLTSGYELGTFSDDTPTREHEMLVTGLDPGTTYHFRLQSDDGLSNVASGGDMVIATASDQDPVAPDIDIWYGREQFFGQIGNPQPWVNILGNVSDPNGVGSLVYSLNGGPSNSLQMGPDDKRLAQLGDFNIEMDYHDLQSGQNIVVITATDTQGHSSTEIVAVQYEAGNVWPLPYTIDWSTTAKIQDVAQVVDGQWELETASVRPVVLDYDRLIAVGDLTWTDYEIAVPVTIHGFDPSGFAPPSNGPGVGLLLRWPGHSGDFPLREEYRPYGALGFYRYAQVGSNFLQLEANFDGELDRQDRTLQNEVTYIFKMRVETVPGVGGLYSFKVWPQSDTEPPGWDVSGQEHLTDPQNGSILLIAHHVDASFGSVSIVPLDTQLTGGSGSQVISGGLRAGR